MRVSLNGVSVDAVSERVISGEYGLYELDGAYVIVSREDSALVIEAAEGRGASRLVRWLMKAARNMQMSSVCWVLSDSRIRLCQTLGFAPTGESRTGGNGVTQYKVAS